MAPASNEEQFKFLTSCIRYSNYGKVGSYSKMFILTSAILTATRSTSANLPTTARLFPKTWRKSYLRHCLLASLTPTPSPITSSLGSHHSSISPQPKQTQSDHFDSAKRNERLMKFYGVHKSQSDSTSVFTVRETSIASPRRKSPLCSLQIFTLAARSYAKQDPRDCFARRSSSDFLTLLKNACNISQGVRSGRL